MLRITRLGNASEAVHLLLEGKLTGPWVRELQTAVARAGGMPRPLVLDLGGIHFIDDEGLALIRDWLDQGATLRNASPFVVALLNDFPRH